MPVNVILGTQEIQIEEVGGDLIDTIAYQSIDTITYVNNPGTVVVSSTLGAAPTVSGSPQWSLLLWLRDGRKAVIELGNVANQSGWTNDQTGFDQAVDDIYAAFPTGGGGVASVTGTDPIVSSGGANPDISIDAGVNRGAYGAGLTLNYLDIVTQFNQIWEWQSTTTTATDWATDSGNFIAIGFSPSGFNSVTLLADTDNQNLSENQLMQTFYITDAAGSASVTDPGTIQAGFIVQINVSSDSTSISFSPFVDIDGNGASTVITAGGVARFTSIGSGSWITT